jgi:hypothetical protein
MIESIDLGIIVCELMIESADVRIIVCELMIESAGVGIRVCELNTGTCMNCGTDYSVFDGGVNVSD